MVGVFLLKYILSMIYGTVSAKKSVEISIWNYSNISKIWQCHRSFTYENKFATSIIFTFIVLLEKLNAGVY